MFESGGFAALKDDEFSDYRKKFRSIFAVIEDILEFS